MICIPTHPTACKRNTEKGAIGKLRLRTARDESGHEHDLGKCEANKVLHREGCETCEEPPKGAAVGGDAEAALATTKTDPPDDGTNSPVEENRPKTNDCSWS